ncbi:MAG: hypothetical protein ISS82_04590 [Nanoarchaeota archaeon]|nr:hypothetical protein [Nanoarchaeota archaeon]
MCKTRIYKRYGKNETDVRYNFQKEFPKKIILDIKRDKTYKPIAKNKRYLKRRYLIKAKERLKR